MWRATVTIRLKEGVLDPQGKAIEKGLQSLGYEDVRNVGAGKHIELLLNDASMGARNEAEAAVQRMCEQLLANPVMERYEIRVEPVEGAQDSPG